MNATATLTFVALLSLPLAIGCGGDTADEDDAGSDAEADADTDSDADSDADSDGDVDYIGVVRVRDYMTGEAVEGAEAYVGDELNTTDEGGWVEVEADGEPMVIELVVEGYRDHYLFLGAAEDDFELGTILVSDTAASAVMSLFGASLDDSKGIVVAAVFGDDGSFASGVSVDLDLDYEGVIAADSSSPYGFSGGNTTLEDSSGWIVFLNVEPGTVVPELSSDDLSCTAWPGSGEPGEFEVVAGAVTHTHLDCR